jgi:hypothetical protein
VSGFAEPTTKAATIGREAGAGGCYSHPEVEGILATSSKDRFEAICKALGEMQAKHCMRGELLRVVCQPADCTPSNLPDRIRKMVTEHSRVEDSKRLKEENARLNLEVGSLINEN